MSTTQIELAGRTPGDDFDTVEVAGDLSLGGTLSIELIDGFEPEVGDEFVVMTYGSADGKFFNVVSDRGYDWVVDYGANQLTLTATAVPEPSALLLLILGASALLAARRRRR